MKLKERKINIEDPLRNPKADSLRWSIEKEEDTSISKKKRMEGITADNTALEENGSYEQLCNAQFRHLQ